MKQASLDLSLNVKKTRKREFLEQMDKAVPWQSLTNLFAMSNLSMVRVKLQGALGRVCLEARQLAQARVWGAAKLAH